MFFFLAAPCHGSPYPSVRGSTPSPPQLPPPPPPPTICGLTMKQMCICPLGLSDLEHLKPKAKRRKAGMRLVSCTDIVSKSAYARGSVSWEPEGRYHNSTMFRWEPEGGSGCCSTPRKTSGEFWNFLWTAKTILKGGFAEMQIII